MYIGGGVLLLIIVILLLIFLLSASQTATARSRAAGAAGGPLVHAEDLLSQDDILASRSRETRSGSPVHASVLSHRCILGSCVGSAYLGGQP